MARISRINTDEDFCCGLGFVLGSVCRGGNNWHGSHGLTRMKTFVVGWVLFWGDGVSFIKLVL
ncbi:MAG: hypothetical protein KJ592_00955 [Nanoarchaeota archaeon]|nr:hypothetical protein [Nanoarchaeota archaeon]